MARSTCTVPSCDAPVVGRGWCSKHYTRARRYGDPTARMPAKGNRVARIA